MQTLHRTLVAATLLFVPLLANAGGGMTARLEGPAKDGMYFVHTLSCGREMALGVRGTAEGVVNGARRTVPLKIEAVGDGVYRFRRSWPQDGEWIVRLAVDKPHGAVTLASIASDGRVSDTQLLWETNGRKECDAKLAAATK